MEAFLVSTGVVALAELGDKSQLLVLGLAARFRKPVPIILGIFLATVLNHALAGVVGTSLGARIGPQSLRWLLGLSFVGVAVWMLLSNGRDPAIPRMPRLGVFGTTLATFFMMEMGDKTQVVAMALAASYGSLFRGCGLDPGDPTGGRAGGHSWRRGGAKNAHGTVTRNCPGDVSVVWRLHSAPRRADAMKPWDLGRMDPDGGAWLNLIRAIQPTEMDGAIP